MLFLKEFHREGDSYTVDVHKLPVPVSARYIRFNPTKSHDWNCLRVEVYGADSEWEVSLISLLLVLVSLCEFRKTMDWAGYQFVVRGLWL